VVTASAGPIVASLVGDYFPSAERGQIYSWILAGELAGAGVGFAVTGDIASLSWRAAFFILAIPAFFLAWFVWRLPEPARGGRRPLFRDGEEPQGPPSLGLGHRPPPETDAQRLAREKGITADPNLVLHDDPRRMGLLSATKYLFRIRSQVILIVASACVYFYLSGIETFGVEFAKEQFKVGQAVANGLVLLIGVGAVVGVLAGGGLADRLMRRRYLKGRILVPAIAAIVSTVAFVPALLSRSVVAAVPYFMIAAFGLTAQNPPIDAARLDITPPLLWGRAEGIRTFLRTLAQSLAPILFGALSGVFGGGRSGLQWTFIVLLIPMAANGYFLIRCLRTYPEDVATAAGSAAQDPGPRGSRDSGGGDASGSGGSGYGGAESGSGRSGGTGSGGVGPERWSHQSPESDPGTGSGSGNFDPWAPPSTWEDPTRSGEPGPRGGGRGSREQPPRWQPPDRGPRRPGPADPPSDPPSWEPPPNWRPPSR
ncbi:MAG: MFS transporter, partial [Acidimicrobiales bacterium]